MVVPVVPHVLKEGMAFALLPCKHHVPTVESMLGPSCHHHFFGDGHACVLCKSLALLLLAYVDGKWKVWTDSLVEIGGSGWLILAYVVRMWVTSCCKVTALRPSVGSLKVE